MLLLVDVSKDQQKRQDEMEVDGGDLDNDAIEREWYQLTVLTSIAVTEAEVKGLVEHAMTVCFESYMDGYRDVRKHFVDL